ncbi:MAG: hypothetical protein JWM95_4290 [Gemmatimonadetes bacterium]|nr:hypothetical protein [Gemmatimonadota bacterium]
MAAARSAVRARLRARYAHCALDCPIHANNEIATLGDFFAVFHSLLRPHADFWFRGHASLKFQLTPSALRFPQADRRTKALGLVTDMRRFLEMRLPRPPAADDPLGWTQVAQHYGLPTRLLDWTRNAAVALFFACSRHDAEDGLVVILNPIQLNQAVDRAFPRVFNLQRDERVIRPYFDLDGRVNARGKRTIAIDPAWNTERIAMQQGAFTLHGSRNFDLNAAQASSLMYVPILREHKASLLHELERVGIGEMFIFPEPEHVCSHLRRAAGL